MNTLGFGQQNGLRLLCAVLFFCVPSAAQERRQAPEFRSYGEPASASDGAEIDALTEEFRLAWGNQDTGALIALHADDVEWINAYARMFQNRKALGEFLEERLFPAFPPAVSKQEAESMKIISTRYLGNDAAVVHLFTEGSRGESRNIDERLRRTHLHLVLAKQENAWKIVHTAIMDAR